MKSYFGNISWFSIPCILVFLIILCLVHANEHFICKSMIRKINICSKQHPNEYVKKKSTAIVSTSICSCCCWFYSASKSSVWFKDVVRNPKTCSMTKFLIIEMKLPTSDMIVSKLSQRNLPSHLCLSYFQTLKSRYLSWKTRVDFFIWVYLTHFEPSQLLGLRRGKKTRDRQEKHLITRKQNLACLTCDPS